jgi:hypothetical protein
VTVPPNFLFPEYSLRRNVERGLAPYEEPCEQPQLLNLTQQARYSDEVEIPEEKDMYVRISLIGRIARSAMAITAPPGFEPKLTGSEPVVLPLHYGAKFWIRKAGEKSRIPVQYSL